MDRNTFGRLCRLLKDHCGLVAKKFVTVEEQVAMFLAVLSHHQKTRVVGFSFTRSSQTVSRYMHVVLYAVLKLHEVLLVKPEPVDENCTDARSSTISAEDSRILRDALSWPHGLKVPKGQYYLCDNGYANSDGFMTPYKGVRYHLKEWGPACEAPQTPAELFNMRHTKARNIIGRAFAVMKMRWGILRSASFYPIDVQTSLIIACFLLHNFICGQMEVDPLEVQIDSQRDDGSQSDADDDGVAFI
ncbi:uncharacterized protein LOC121788619 [Salvia splendens]|uniref:uncharacterized protein LOC121788619 n=1 Tax=Salvia splendens TaxID=180675 RepID=UPI001C2692FC|nr:uncharacterized protein LOC121788619 [Salvia splendens]